MKCPKCGLINPDSTQICDCGFNFSQIRKRITENKESIEKPEVEENLKKPKKNRIILISQIIGWIFILMTISQITGVLYEYNNPDPVYPKTIFPKNMPTEIVCSKLISLNFISIIAFICGFIGWKKSYSTASLTIMILSILFFIIISVLYGGLK